MTESSVLKARLNEAADYLDYLYEGSRHLPQNLLHDYESRVGLVIADAPGRRPIAQFCFGGAAEVFLALGPVVLPVLARWLRTEAYCIAGDEDHTVCLPSECTALAALMAAETILKAKERGKKDDEVDPS